MHSSRREWLGLLGAASLRAASTKPELILVNGNIHTMDPANPHAQAVAIAGGRFFAVGTGQEIGNLPTAGATRVDLGGRTVVPGLIDAHLHTASSGLRHLKDVNCEKSPLRSRAVGTSTFFTALGDNWRWNSWLKKKNSLSFVRRSRCGK
jgi:N-acyl-D-aspartate/D-glutamate deacylase